MKDISTGLSTEQRAKAVEVLNVYLANTYVLYTKTQGFHWNVESPRFSMLHDLFEEQYKDLAETLDETAERIRALGEYAPGSLKEMLEHATLQEHQGPAKDQDMVQMLLNDYETVIQATRKAIDVCDEIDDVVTEDYLTGELADLEKTAWMLRSTLV